MEKGIATQSSILAWGFPWTEESQRVGHIFVTKQQQMHVWRQEKYGESLYFSLSFFCELKTALSNIFKIVSHAWEEIELLLSLEGAVFFLRGLRGSSEDLFKTEKVYHRKILSSHQNYYFFHLVKMRRSLSQNDGRGHA